MEITLKNVSINEKFSEETLMFMADVYVDGKKCAYAKNDGHGGSTFYHSYEGQIELLKKAEAYAMTLPARFTKEKDGFDAAQNLEGLIDDMAYAISNQKNRERFEKKMKKHMLSNILVGVPGSGSYKLSGYKKTLAEIITLPEGKLAVQNAVNRMKNELKPGEVILNTNLQALGITI